ncbi:MAG: hypothetical protein ACJAZP_003872 [Psychromonas sp.]|jgi:hypothetical protein|uniref:hypothetical protein n=1 Tax=Psychromonas sp. TaxID=1884585 RepID=UPI0039E23CC1
MIQKMQLAQSYWPRTGCDRANRSHVGIPGPDHGNILFEVQLPHNQSEIDYHERGGCVVTDTMTLRVAYDRFLSSITLTGEILWSVELPDILHAFPVALQGGSCLVSLGNTICVYSDSGDCVFQHDIEEQLDDSGVSPNLTDTGDLILGCTDGLVFCLDAMEVKEVVDFGYDILPPAIYPDNSLAISGYHGVGFCRVRLSGQKVWTTDFKCADLLPTINRQNVSAVGSLDDEKSAFFSADGDLLGTYPRAAIFAEYSSQAWIARSHKYLAKLTASGQECWGYKLHDDSNWGHCQPIVDSQGRIYVVDDDKLLCFSGDGQIVFATDIQGSYWGGLSCIFPGKLAFVGGGKLKIIG